MKEGNLLPKFYFHNLNSLRFVIFYINLFFLLFNFFKTFFLAYLKSVCKLIPQEINYHKKNSILGKFPWFSVPVENVRIYRNPAIPDIFSRSVSPMNRGFTVFGGAHGLFRGAQGLFGGARHPFAPPGFVLGENLKKKSFYVNYPLSVIRYPVPDNYRIIRLSGTGLSGKFTGLSGSGRIVICAPVTPLKFGPKL